MDRSVPLCLCRNCCPTVITPITAAGFYFVDAASSGVQSFQDCARFPGLTVFSKMSRSSLGVSPAVAFSETSGEFCVVPM